MPYGFGYLNHFLPFDLVLSLDSEIVCWQINSHPVANMKFLGAAVLSLILHLLLFCFLLLLSRFDLD